MVAIRLVGVKGDVRVMAVMALGVIPPSQTGRAITDFPGLVPDQGIARGTARMSLSQGHWFGRDLHRIRGLGLKGRKGNVGKVSGTLGLGDLHRVRGLGDLGLAWA